MLTFVFLLLLIAVVVVIILRRRRHRRLSNAVNVAPDDSWEAKRQEQQHSLRLFPRAGVVRGKHPLYFTD